MSASGSPDGSYQLELVQGDVVASRHPLSLRPLRLGRGANNDIILVDDAASTNHARVWVEVDGPRIEDLGSRNGTWVNGERLAGLARLGPEDEVRLGGSVGLRVRAVDEGAGAVPHVEDIVTGNRYAFQCDRLSLGDGADADIQVPGAKVGCAILVEPDGSVWLGGPDSLVAITLGQTFEVGGRPFRLAHSSPDDGVTRELLLPHELAAARYPYTLEVRLAGPTGPQATFRYPKTGAAHTILAENPAAGDLGFDEFVEMDVTAAAELANQDVKPGDISSAVLIQFGLKAVSGQADLSFMEAMDVSVASAGLPSLLIASESSFPEGAATVDFDPTGADIAEYVVSQSMTITTDVTAHRPESDTVVRASWTVVVGVTTQGAVSNLDR